MRGFQCLAAMEKHTLTGDSPTSMEMDFTSF